jgi:hypothetical protein
MKIIKISLLLVFSILVEHLYSQKENILGKEIIAGFHIPVGEDISKVHNTGYSTEIRLVYVVYDSVRIKPFINYSYFSNNLFNALREDLNLFDFGGTIDYVFLRNSKVKIYIGPSLKMSYFTINSVISSSMRQTNKRGKIMSDFIFAYDIRLGLMYKNFILELSYKPYKSTPNLSEGFVDSKENIDELYQLYKINEREFNLSTTTLSLGLIF